MAFFQSQRKCLGHTGGVNAVRFTRTGDYCMSASDDKTIRLWNPHKDDPARSGEALQIKVYSESHSYPIYSLAIASDNTKFVAGGGDRNVFYYDVATGNISRRISGHGMQKVNAVALNADGTVLLTASDDKTVKLWDLRSNFREPIQTLDQFRDSVTCLDQTASTIVAGSVDGGVRIFDLRAGQLHVDHIQDPVTSVKYSANEKSILAMCLGGYIRLLDVSSGKILQEYQGGHQHQSFKSEASLSADGNDVICGSENSVVCTYHFLTGELQRKVTLEPLKKIKGSAATSTTLPSREQVVLNDSEVSQENRQTILVSTIACHPDKPIVLAGTSDGSIRCLEMLPIPRNT